MAQRMTRAQREAVGPGGGRPMDTALTFTVAQQALLKRLKRTYGAKNIGAPSRNHHTGNMTVPAHDHVAKRWMVFDPDGNYVEQYTQLSLDTEGTRGDTT